MSFDLPPTGTYIIHSLLEEDGNYVGCEEFVDLSLKSRRIIAFPKSGVAPKVGLVLQNDVTQI